MRRLTPEAALESAILYALVSCSIRKGPKGRPGEVIERCPEHIRKALRKLKAEHTQHRVEYLL